MAPKGTITQFFNCKILRDHQIVWEDLWIRNKKIINPEPVFFVEKVIPDVKVDCQGSLLAPGFIDVQINGGFGRDFSTDVENAEEAVEIVANGILQHGVTSFCPTLITSPSSTYHKILPKITRKDGDKQRAGVLGVHLEGPFINKEKKGAHPVQHIKPLENGVDDVLNTYGSLNDVSIITVAPELDPTGDVIRHLVEQGVKVSLGHSNADISEGEHAMKSGASFITHLFNAMLPFHHRDPGLVGLLTSEKLPENKTVFYGLIADGVHTHPAALRIAYRSNPKGLVLVTDAMSAMGLKPGKYCIGEQQVEVCEKKAVVSGTSTLSGSIATMDSCIRHLHSAAGCSTVQALECATLHPAQLLGITRQKGTLDFGTDADFVMLNDNLHVLATYIAGDCVWQSDQHKVKC